MKPGRQQLKIAKKLSYNYFNHIVTLNKQHPVQCHLVQHPVEKSVVVSAISKIIIKKFSSGGMNRRQNKLKLYFSLKSHCFNTIQVYIIKVAKLSPSSQVASKFKRTP